MQLTNPATERGNPTLVQLTTSCRYLLHLHQAKVPGNVNRASAVIDQVSFGNTKCKLCIRGVRPRHLRHPRAPVMLVDLSRVAWLPSIEIADLKLQTFPEEDDLEYSLLPWITGA